MEHILNGIKQFQEGTFIKKRSLFRELEHEQHPKALFITCSDSRIDPTLITQSEPGELFVLRNAGNIIPPHGSDMGVGQEATIDYALNHLHVEHIIICGHTDCGALKSIIEHPEEELSPPLRKWLSCAHEVREHAWANSSPHRCSDQELLEAAQLNVKIQLKHVATLPCVIENMASRSVQLHGWVYCLHNADVYSLDMETGEYSAYSTPPSIEQPTA